MNERMFSQMFGMPMRFLLFFPILKNPCSYYFSNSPYSYYILSSYYKIKTNPLLPTFILVKDNDIFKPLIDSNDDNIDTLCFLYSKNKNIIESLWKYFKLDEIKICIEELKEDKNGNEETFNNLDLSKLKKLKVDELKEICIKYEISLTKISDKTSKMINKTKTELMEDIEAYIKK